jgi:hypothetical protein
MTITLTHEEAQQVLECMETAIKAGDWVVDGACDPDFILYMLRARLAQPEPERKQVIEPQLSPKARAAVREAYSALVKWQTICLQKNRSAKELTIPTNAIFTLIKLMEVEGLEQ